MGTDATMTLRDWVARFKAEQDPFIRRLERLRYQIADDIKWKAREIANNIFGHENPYAAARTKGRSGELQRSIDLEMLPDGRLAVTAGGPGVPYAAVQEEGTVGRGGTMPDIVPVNAKALTIPLMSEYVGRRAREFDLFLVNGKDLDEGGPAVLMNRVNGEAAYLLVKRVALRPKPYLKPAVEEVAKDETVKQKLADTTGWSGLPWGIVRL